LKLEANDAIADGTKNWGKKNIKRRNKTKENKKKLIIIIIILPFE
jgi:hypothetical protein